MMPTTVVLNHKVHTLEYLITLHMYGWIKRSHSIHMLNIQIDTKSFELVICHQFNNIKLSFFANHVCLIHAVRLLDTLEHSINPYLFAIQFMWACGQNFVHTVWIRKCDKAKSPGKEKEMFSLLLLLRALNFCWSLILQSILKPLRNTYSKSICALLHLGLN